MHRDQNPTVVVSRLESEPLRIIHLITGLNIGGAEMMLTKLVSRLDRSRFHNVVVSMTGFGVLGSRIEAIGVPVHALNMPRGRPSMRGVMALVRLLRRERPDIVQTWLYHADLLGVVATGLSRRRNIIWNIRSANHDLRAYPQLTAFAVRLCARLSRLPRAVVVNSENGRRLHEQRGYHPRQWAVIPNGFDLDEFRPDLAARCRVRAELGIPEEATLIGWVGRDHPLKAPAVFLQAALRVLQTAPDVRMVMVGRHIDADNAALTTLLGDGNTSEAVQLLGQRSDVRQLMAAMDVFVLSSSSEGFPNVVGEAMATGLPCVVTDVGDAARLVGTTGLVVRPGDPNELADGILRLLTVGPAVRQDLGRAARLRIQEHFSLDAITQRYAALYQTVGSSR